MIINHILSALAENVERFANIGGFMLPNKVYDVLKWISLVFLPAFITFYGVVATTCNIPHTQETLTIMVGFNTFLGTILGISNSQYKKGEK